jgi:hypothetical protein
LKTDLEVIVGGVLLLMLLARATRGNQAAAVAANPYAFNASESAMINPGQLDLNAWNALNATPQYYLGQVPAQSPLTAYFANSNTAFIGGQSAPVGMF